MYVHNVLLPVFNIGASGGGAYPQQKSSYPAQQGGAYPSQPPASYPGQYQYQASGQPPPYQGEVYLAVVQMPEPPWLRVRHTGY